MSIIDKIKNSGTDLLMNSIGSIPVVGGLFQGIGKILLDKDDATKEEVEQAMQNATPDQIALIQKEIEKAQIEAEKEALIVKKAEIDREIKGMDFLEKFFKTLATHKSAKWWVISYIAYFHIALGIALWYCDGVAFDQDDVMEFIHKSILVMVISAPVIPMALIFKPIYNVIESLCESITVLVNVPKNTVKGVENVLSKLSNKIK